MATVSLSLSLPSSSSSSFPTSNSRKPISRCISYSQLLKSTSPDPILIKPITTTSRKHNQFHAVVVKATKEDDPPLPDTTTATSESEKEPESSSSQTEPAKDELTELGAEIKKAMQENKGEGGEKDFWSGVAEEIGEIEWPAFGKVLGTTGVVIGVIAGSSVVLLTVNAVLAELSDKVFAGRGVQDFFG